MSLQVRFWGTRGSIPTPTTAGSAAFGGNTPCVTLHAPGAAPLVCDAGTGLRLFGDWALKQPDPPRAFNFFLSHLHWDHIQGFPFFAPAYRAETAITIHGGHDGMHAALAGQQQAPYFPVTFSSLPATLVFQHLTPGARHRCDGWDVSLLQQEHPGVSYAYRFDRGGKSVIYATDGEHKMGSDDPAFLDFIAGADLLIIDAMYSRADAEHLKRDWGHASNIVAVEFALRAGVRRLALFHHDPDRDDAALRATLAETQRYAEQYRPGAGLVVQMAADGLALEL